MPRQGANPAIGHGRVMGMRVSLAYIVACGILACVSAGCYDAEQVKAFLLQSHAVVAGVEYRVLPPDIIQFHSAAVPEINGQSQTVRPDGKVNLPLLGEVDVAGKTCKEIEEAIKAAAKEYYEKVDATVQVTGYNSQKYYVFGEVSRPGPMPWTGTDSFLDAMAKAQPMLLAWPEQIIVIRGNQPQQGGFATSQPTEKAAKEYHDTGVHPPDPLNPRHKLVINLLAMVQKGDMANNILLMPNDIIYVQPSVFGVITHAVEIIVSPTRPVLEAVRVPAAVSGAAP